MRCSKEAAEVEDLTHQHPEVVEVANQCPEVVVEAMEHLQGLPEALGALLVHLLSLL